MSNVLSSVTMAVAGGFPPEPEVPQELTALLARIGERETFDEWEAQLEDLHSALERADIPETDSEALLLVATEIARRSEDGMVEWCDLIELLSITEARTEPIFGISPSREAYARKIRQLERKIAEYDGPGDEEVVELKAEAERLSREFEAEKARHADLVRGILQDHLGRWSVIPQEKLSRIKNTLLYHRAMCMFDINYFKFWFPHIDPPGDLSSLSRLVTDHWKQLDKAQRMPIREEFDRFRAAYKAVMGQ